MGGIVEEGLRHESARLGLMKVRILGRGERLTDLDWQVGGLAWRLGFLGSKVADLAFLEGLWGSLARKVRQAKRQRLCLQCDKNVTLQ